MKQSDREKSTPETLIAEIFRAGVETGKAGHRGTKQHHDDAAWCATELMIRLGETGTKSQLYDRFNAAVEGEHNA